MGQGPDAGLPSPLYTIGFQRDGEVKVNLATVQAEVQQLSQEFGQLPVHDLDSFILDPAMVEPTRS